MKSVVTDDMKLLLTGRDAALVCGCTIRLWRMWDKLGFTPMPVKIGKRYFWKHQELIHWIDAGCPRREEWEAIRELQREASQQKSHNNSGGRLPETRKIKNS